MHIATSEQTGCKFLRNANDHSEHNKTCDNVLIWHKLQGNSITKLKYLVDVFTSHFDNSLSK